MKCLKFDESKVDLSKTATWNIWMQFGVDVEKLTEEFRVEEHYMPNEVQNELIDYMSKNYKKLKQYKRNKKMFEDHVAWEYLNYFPTSVDKDGI